MTSKTYLALAFISGMTACSAPADQKADETRMMETVSVDSLRSIFVDGWNRHDSSAIMNTLAPEAIVMNDSLIHQGTADIAANWVSGGVKVLSNIQTTSLVQESDESIAYDGGTYTLDLNIPGGPVLKEKGNYTMTWKKQQDGSWRLTMVHIEDITRMPDVSGE